MQNASIVAKFGGTSVANVSAIENCIRIIKASPNTRLVVVSAQSGITNLLVKLAKQQAPNITQTIETIRQIISPILSHIDSQALSIEIDSMLDELTRLCLDNKQNTAHASDILSFGERISSRLVCAMMINSGIKAKHVDARELIVLTDQEPDIEKIKANINDKVLPDIQDFVIITEGFIAKDQHGHTTTLGRGGSDYSAALISEALNAKALQIWTDVNGVYQTDPRAIKNAQAIDSISFNEAAELATFGAKVLHPATLWPAVRQNIRVFVGSSFNPSAGGTWIVPEDECHNTAGIHAIAERKNQTLLTIKSYEMFQARGFLAGIFNILAKHKVSVDLVTTSEVSVALTLDYAGSQSLHSSLITEALLEELQSLGNVKISIENDLSLIAVVGSQLHVTKGISGELFSELTDYNIRLVSHGASGHNICLLVNKDQSLEVIERIYNKFFINHEVLKEMIA
ncbi:lysine-sensitive aspartokinase 3 [Thiotrichales bacterium 19S11-10]|nr:lysine-sensitive aspartokinase 3 [Thiotrichales bacterium 19S11-10]